MCSSKLVAGAGVSGSSPLVGSLESAYLSRILGMREASSSSSGPFDTTHKFVCEPSASLAEDLEERLASEAQAVVDPPSAAMGLREPCDFEPREVGGDGGWAETQFLR